MNDENTYFHLGCGGQLVDTGTAVENEPQFRCAKCSREGCPDLLWDEDAQDPHSTEFEFNGQSFRVVQLVLPAKYGEPMIRRQPGHAPENIIMRRFV